MKSIADPENLTSQVYYNTIMEDVIKTFNEAVQDEDSGWQGLGSLTATVMICTGILMNLSKPIVEAQESPQKSCALLKKMAYSVGESAIGCFKDNAKNAQSSEMVN